MSMFPIASATGTGAAGSFNFTNIPQTYTHLQLRLTVRNYTTVPTLYHYFNGDFAGTNYAQHLLAGDGASPFTSYNTSIPYFVMDSMPKSNDTASVNGSVIIDVLDYTSTSKYKTVKVTFGYDLNGSGRVGIWSGVWMSTAAINSWILTPGFSTASRADLYGITSSGITGA